MKKKNARKINKRRLSVRNENPALPNKNTLYVGMSGSGKSNVLRQNPGGKGKRVVLFDPNSDHPATRYRERREFLLGLAAAFKSAAAFRVAYTPAGDDRYSEHEFFCEAVCRVLDGKAPLVVIDEELAQSCKSAGKAERWHKKMMNEGRKYGLIYHGVVQIPQRVPKDVFDNCFFLNVGKSLRLPAYVVEAFGVSREAGIALENMEFLLCSQSGEQKKHKFNYKK